MAAAAKSKKAPRNGFTVFLREMRTKLRSVSDDELLNVALSGWKALNSEEKKKYDARAKELRSHQARNCFGYVVSELDAQRLAVAEKRNEIEALTEQQVRSQQTRNLLFKSFDEGGFSFCVASASFYLPTNAGKVHPAEFALCRATLSDGLLPSLETHYIMKLKDFAPNDAGAAVDLSKQTHKIPMSYPGCEDYAKVVGDIKRIVDGVPGLEHLPIFAHPQMVDQLELFLTHVWSKAGDASPPPSVCSIVFLARLAFGEEWVPKNIFLVLTAGLITLPARKPGSRPDEKHNERRVCETHEEELWCHPAFCTFFQVRDLVHTLYELCMDYCEAEGMS